MSAITGFESIIFLVGLLIGFVICFLPSILAVLRGNVFKGQVIKYQLIVLAITVVVVVALSVFFIFASSEVQSNSMEQSAVVLTQEASVGAADSAENDMTAARTVGVVLLAGGALWLLIAVILWFYIFLHAMRDQQMTLLSRFGINI